MNYWKVSFTVGSGPFVHNIIIPAIDKSETKRKIVQLKLFQLYNVKNIEKCYVQL